MPLIYVDTLDDPRLDAFARLTEAQLRSKLEPERALFIAESQKVIERAFEGGMEPISLLMEEKWLPSMAPLIERMEKRTSEQTSGEGLPVFVAPHDELERLTGFELTRGALGAFRRPALPAVADVLRGARLVAVLEDITNHTNVGAIFRSAAALGVDAVLASPAATTRCTAGPCAYPWERSSKFPGPASAMRTCRTVPAAAPGAYEASPSCTSTASLRRHGALRRIRDPRRAERAPDRARGHRRRAPRSWRCCSAPRARGSPPPPLRGAITPCASPWLTASIP